MSPAAPRARRASWAAMVLLPLTAAVQPAAAQPSALRSAAGSAAATAEVITTALAAELRACVRAVDASAAADGFGTRRVDLSRSCPTLAARLAAQPLPGMRGRASAGDGSVSQRQLVDLMQLAESATEPSRYVGQLSSVRLGMIIDALDPAARGELSTRARLARWWRALVGEFDPTDRTQRSERRRIAWPLGFWSTVSWVSFGIAALLVVTVLVQELRAALGMRMQGRRAAVRAPRRRDPLPDLAAIDALPPRQRAGALLRAVAERLHARGALAKPDPLTPREVGRAARLPADERAGLQLIAAAGETGAFGREEPAPATLAAARAAAARWLERGDALARLRAWRRAGGARGVAQRDGAGGTA